MKKKFLIWGTSCLNTLEPHVSILREKGYEVVVGTLEHGKITDEIFRQLLPGTQALISGPVVLNEKHLAIAGNLKVVSICASGYDNVNIPFLTSMGIVVTNVHTPEMAFPVADHTFGLMLSVVRQIPFYDRLVKKGSIESGIGRLVWGKTIGIVGLGVIGKEVAKRAKGFAMKILFFDKMPDESFAREWGIRYVSLDELLENSDYVTLHLRLNDETRGMLGQRELALMKPTAYLINTARQELVDKEALYKALTEGKIAGAAIDDVYPREIVILENVVSTPHLGNRCWESLHDVLKVAIRNALDVLEGRRPQHIVNPEVYDNSMYS